ncbi:MAG: ATP-dependent sacrificial sulfur transferase LarE [Myxococcota bacterium]|nr:TIGR00268 family protein [Spirochaeta sp.]RPG07554.1 MAG: ATP-dependent sacrificial sulfur transferase LarE [Proteobacteria bacterium TMED72]
MAKISQETLGKEAQLFKQLKEAGRLLVAFSGGVDSSYLAWAAKQALGDDCLAVTAVSPSYPQSHRGMAEEIVRDFRIPHRFIETAEMERAEYRRNAADRCYYCKTELFERMEEVLEGSDFDKIAYGINRDDQGDFRPGHRAAEEHRILSPLLDANLSKEEIRALSYRAGLPCWDLPASACLASRLPYGTEVTSERLSQVEEGEERLRAMGFRQVRLRHHGDLARIEIDPAEMQDGVSAEKMEEISAAVRPLGFKWVCLDLDGYQLGSLNRALPASHTISLRIPVSGSALDSSEQ